MDQNFSSLFAGAVLLFILINICIVFYLKYKRNLLFRAIRKRKYQLIKNVGISFVNQSDIDINLTYTTADIIFLEEEILVIPRNRPVLQLSSNPEILLPGTQKLTVTSRLVSGDQLELNVHDDMGSMTIILNVKNKNFDFHPIDKHL